MKRTRVSFCFLSLAAVATAWASYPAAAKDGVSFAGKTITMVIGQAAGGGTDLYGRALGQNLVRYLPGQPALIVLDQPGAGGVVALNNWVKKAKPDGLSVTIGAQSQVDPDALMRTHAVYDPSTFEYVGGVAAPSQALFINKDAIKRLHDKTANPVNVGVVGSTLRSGSYQVLWGAAFLGWNIKWVHGYGKTSEIRAAMERGEIDMTTFGAIRDLQFLLGSGKFEAISQTGTVEGGKRVPRDVLGNTPIIFNLLEGKVKDPLAIQAVEYSENVAQVGRFLALPPKTPEKITAIYVNAFEATLKDPQYRAQIAKIDPDSPVAHKADLERLIKNLAKVSPKTLEYVGKELNRQGFGSR